MLLNALSAHKEGKFNKARDAYESALKVEESAKGYRLYGTLLIELGEMDAATDVLRKALKCEVQERDVSGGKKDARPELHDGLYLRDSSISSCLALLLSEAGNIEEARKLAREAIEANSADFDANWLLILIFVNEGCFDEAVRQYDAAPNSVRTAFPICQELSEILAHEGRIEESIRIRNYGRNIPQSSLLKTQSHELMPVTTDFMIPYLDAQPHPEVELLETKAASEHSPSYVTIRDAVILAGEWLVLSRNHTIFLDMNHGTPTGDPPYYIGQSYAPNALLPQPTRKTYDKAILVGGDMNYFHWVVDFLPRLMALGKTPALDDYPILIHETLLPYQREGLALAGIPEERVITLEYPACYPCKELILPLFPSNTPEMQNMRSRRSAIAWLRNLVSPFTGKGRKIYISRMDSKRRMIIREDELIALLEKEEFEILALAGLSQKEQIETFSQAEIIIGGSGAGFGNLAFAPEHCRIMEIINPSWHNQQIETLAGIRGQRYFSVSCRTYFDEPTSAIFHDFYLTDRAIEEVLDMVRHP